MVTVAIIPARGGSKGLPRKNLRSIGGRPLIAHTIDAARTATLIDRVVITTDDEAIAAASLNAGAEVPFMRPADLATDNARTVDAVLHAVQELEATGCEVTEIVTLQATSPFRTAAMIDEAVAIMRASEADSVVSVAALPLPASVLGYVDDERWFVRLGAFEDVRRQSAPRAFRLTGAIYGSTRATLAAGSLIGTRPAAIVLEGAAAIDIDTASDLAAARRQYRRLRSS